jgi:hypothetical protein
VVGGDGIPEVEQAPSVLDGGGFLRHLPICVII